jgi:hypothetical protein
LEGQIFITVGHLRSPCCGALSLTRRRAYNLIIPFAVTLGSKARRTYDYILLSHPRLLQPGRPGPRIYIPQEQGGPVIIPGTGFPFCRLLRLAGLRWSAVVCHTIKLILYLNRKTRLVEHCCFYLLQQKHFPVAENNCYRCRFICSPRSVRGKQEILSSQNFLLEIKICYEMLLGAH